MSRFESILSAEIAAEPDGVRQCVLRLKLAAYRARRGDLTDARSEIQKARAKFASGVSAQITAHINFAEGICEYFENGASEALVKLKRSKAIAVGCPPEDDLYALASAWLASAYRVSGQWSEMPEHLFSVFQSDRESSDETHARISIVLADAWNEVSEYSMADVWYKAARRFSLKCGDDLSIGAVMYNRAAIRVFDMRIEEAMGQSVDIKDCHIAIEAASAENFSQYTRDHSMQWVFELLAGQLLMLQGSYMQALNLLDSPKTRGLASDWPSVELLRTADVIRCKSLLAPERWPDECEGAFKLVESVSDRVGAGDMAVALWSLSVACSASDDATAALLRNRSQIALSKYIIQRQLEKKMLEDFSSKASALRGFAMMMQ